MFLAIADLNMLRDLKMKKHDVGTYLAIDEVRGPYSDLSRNSESPLDLHSHVQVLTGKALFLH